MSFIQSIAQGSYSRLKTYAECPRKAQYKFLLKLKEPDSMYASRGGELHKQAAEFLSSPDMELPPSLWNVKNYLNILRNEMHGDATTWNVEQQRAITSSGKETGGFDADVWYRVVMDVCVDFDDEGLIVDHKSGKVYDKEHEAQARDYAACGFNFYPSWEKVEVKFIYIDQSSATPYHFNRRDLPELMDGIERRMNAMSSDVKFEARKNSKCKWCHYRNSNGGPCEIG